MADIKTIEDLSEADNGSYYTICGAGGDLAEWVDGYEKVMKEEGIGTPKNWYLAFGGNVNSYASHKKHAVISKKDEFPSNLNVLMFSIDGLHIGKLAIFKIRMEDRWFDDIISNMRTAS